MASMPQSPYRNLRPRRIKAWKALGGAEEVGAAGGASIATVVIATVVGEEMSAIIKMTVYTGACNF